MSIQRSIIYICISQNSKILSDFKKGNSPYHEIASQIIPVIKQGTNTFKFENTQFMTFSEENFRQLKYLILFEDGYSLTVGEECLKMIKDRFEDNYS